MVLIYIAFVKYAAQKTSKALIYFLVAVCVNFVISVFYYFIILFSFDVISGDDYSTKSCVLVFLTMVLL